MPISKILFVYRHIECNITLHATYYHVVISQN